MLTSYRLRSCTAIIGLWRYDSYYEKFSDNSIRCIDEEIPYELPKNWEWTRLGSVLNTVMGQSPSGNSVTNNGIGKEFHQGKIYFGDKYLNHSDQVTSKPSKLAPMNSVLLCVRAPVGKINITEREVCIGRGLAAIAPITDISVDYIYIMLKNYELDFLSKSTGSTFSAISIDVIKNALIPIPPLQEQTRIVNAVQIIMEKISNIDCNIT